MIGFTEFCRRLSEDVQFVRGRDDDYFYDNFQLITFNRNDVRNYKIEGKTAGIDSHACKHLDEIDSAFVDSVLQQVRNAMVEYIRAGNYPKSYEFNYFDGYFKADKTASANPIKAINTAPREAVINFLDLVNDKRLNGKDLAPIEAKMTKFLDTLGAHYDDYIQNLIKNAVSLDSSPYQNEIRNTLNRSPIVKFGVDRSHRDMIIYLDFTNNTICMREMDGVHTCFRVDGTFATRGAFIQTIMRRFGKAWYFHNRPLFSVLRGMK